MATTERLNPRLNDNSPKQAAPNPPPVTGNTEEVRYLREDEFAPWDNFVDASPQGSLFAHSWWLQAIGGDTRVLACFKNGRICAGIPLHFESHYGLKFCRMPKLTPLWGVLLPPRQGKRVNVASEENGLLKNLATALKKHKFFFQFFNPEFDNWLPFFWQGYSQTTRYTYRIALSDLDCVWQELGHNARNQIRSAQRLGVAIHTCDSHQVFAMEEETYRRQGLRVPHTGEYLNRLYSAAKERGSGECWAAVDPAGAVHCAAFSVWDAKAMYALVLGNSEQRNSGATSLLEWHMLQFAAQKSKVFDFCGSYVEGIERFVRSFGGTRIPYYQITRFPKLLKAYLSYIGKI